MQIGIDRGSLCIALALLAVLAGCGDDKKTAGADDAGMAGGDADAALAPAFAPLALGEPIEAPDKKWTWIDFPETRCMDDSPTGLGIRMNKASDKLLIVMQGGGACFNSATCLTVFNQDGFGADKLAGTTNTGLLKADDENNPFKDW